MMNPHEYSRYHRCAKEDVEIARLPHARCHVRRIAVSDAARGGRRDFRGRLRPRAR